MVECPACSEPFDTEPGLQSHFGKKHEEKHLTVERVGGETIRQLYAKMSENAVANELGVSRTAIQGALRHLGIERRGQSEAEQLKWSQMTPEEREAQVKAAHEKNRELAANGELSLQRWVEENPELASKLRAKHGALGASARDENGMKGVTGQEHPNWRGGKSVYDAVKKQLPGPSWNTIRSRYAGEPCANCGESTTDLHHIVPLLCGGTNEDYNLMSLCQSCHHEAEWHFRDVFDPVLIA